MNIPRYVHTREAVDMLRRGTVIVDALGDVYEFLEPDKLKMFGVSGSHLTKQLVMPVRVLLDGDFR